MAHTTYTVLVTVAHDAGAAPSTDLLAAMIERGLEEGVREMAGLESVNASAIEGDRLGTIRINRAIVKARELHAALRT